MATVFVRIEQLDKTSDKYLVNATAGQETILKRANRKTSGNDPYALFVCLLGMFMPQDNTLANRRETISKVLQYLKVGVNKEGYTNLKPETIAKVANINDKFFSSPYGIFKVLRSPLSLLDPSADYRVSNIIVTNNVDLTPLHAVNTF